MKLIALTVLCVDVYDEASYIGGNSLNFATQCKKSGLETVSILGALGNDAYRIPILSHLLQYDIDASHVHVVEGKTASNRIYIDEKGDRFFTDESWDGGVYQTFRLSAEDLDFVYAHDVIFMVSVDQNFMHVVSQKPPHCRLVVDFLDTRDIALFEAVLPHIAFCFISGDETILNRMKELSTKYKKLIVVTLGENGSIAYDHEKEFFCAANKTAAAEVLGRLGSV